MSLSKPKKIPNETFCIIALHSHNVFVHSSAAGDGAGIKTRVEGGWPGLGTDRPSSDYLNAQRTACHGLLPADVKKILRACRDNFDRLCLPYLQLVKRTDNLLDFKNLVQKAARHHPDLNIMEMMEGNKYTGAWTDANYSRVKVDIEHIIAWSKLAGNIAHFKFLYASGIFEQRYVPFLGVDVDSTDRDYQVALVASVGWAGTRLEVRDMGALWELNIIPYAGPLPSSSRRPSGGITPALAGLVAAASEGRPCLTDGTATADAVIGVDAPYLLCQKPRLVVSSNGAVGFNPRNVSRDRQSGIMSAADEDFNPAMTRETLLTAILASFDLKLESEAVIINLNARPDLNNLLVRIIEWIEPPSSSTGPLPPANEARLKVALLNGRVDAPEIKFLAVKPSRLRPLRHDDVVDASGYVREKPAQRSSALSSASSASSARLQLSRLPATTPPRVTPAIPTPPPRPDLVEQANIHKAIAATSPKEHRDFLMQAMADTSKVRIGVHNRDFLGEEVPQALARQAKKAKTADDKQQKRREVEKEAKKEGARTAAAEVLAQARRLTPADLLGAEATILADNGLDKPHEGEEQSDGSETEDEEGDAGKDELATREPFAVCLKKRCRVRSDDTVMVGLCQRGMPPTEAELDKSNWLPLSLLKKARLGGAVKKWLDAHHGADDQLEPGKFGWAPRVCCAASRCRACDPLVD